MNKKQYIKNTVPCVSAGLFSGVRFITIEQDIKRKNENQKKSTQTAQGK